MLFLRNEFSKIFEDLHDDVIHTSQRPKVDFLKLVDCKIFTRNHLKLKAIYESLPTAWGLKICKNGKVEKNKYLLSYDFLQLMILYLFS